MILLSPMAVGGKGRARVRQVSVVVLDSSRSALSVSWLLLVIGSFGVEDAVDGRS